MSKSVIVKLEIRNPETAAGLAEAISASPGFSLAGDNLPCDVLFLEIGYDLDKEFRLIEQTGARNLAKVIFVTSPRKDPDVLLKAMKAGVKEFFPQPLNKDDVISALVKFRKSADPEGRERTAGKKGIVISVIGSRGGVGATTAAVNLAVSLQETAGNASIVLMDMNPLLGSIGLFLEIPTSFSWADGARDLARIDATYLLNTLYKHSSGVHVLPAPSKPAGLEAATPENMHRLVDMMRMSFDVAVMDGSTSFDDLSLKMIDVSDMILVVTELNLLSTVSAKKLLDTLEGLGVSYGKDVKILVNRYQKKPLVEMGEAEKMLGKKIIARIPNDYETTLAAINAGKSVLELNANSAVADQYRQLGRLLLDKEDPKESPLSLKALGSKVKSIREKWDPLRSFRIRAGVASRREIAAKEKVLASGKNPQ